jgi:hypothetical protein
MMVAAEIQGTVVAEIQEMVAEIQGMVATEIQGMVMTMEAGGFVFFKHCVPALVL